MDKETRIALIEHELNQGDLANRFEVDRSFVSLALRGKRMSKKAQEIRDYVLGLHHKKAA